MTATQLEQLAKEAHTVLDANCMYVTGRTLRKILFASGKRMERTLDNQPIIENQLYMVTPQGVFLVEA